MTGAIALFDASVLKALYAMRDPMTAQVFIWVTELGSTTMILGLTIVVGLLFILLRRFPRFLGFAVAVGGTAATVFLLKEIIHRARPDEAFQAYLETGFSLPSGHTALSLAFYGFLAWILWHSIPQKNLRVLSLVFLSALIIAIGFSRLYLGVHWMSDVAASAAIAVFFLWTGITIEKKLERVWGR